LGARTTDGRNDGGPGLMAGPSVNGVVSVRRS
jgi:hypothetical protein